MTTQKTNDWRERFDEKFKTLEEQIDYDNFINHKENVKSFIERLIEEQREEIRGEIIKLINASYFEDRHDCIVRNDGLRDVLALPCLQTKEK